MASVRPRAMTVDAFAAIEWDPEVKAELGDGVVCMMAGGSGLHARGQANIIGALFVKLTGSGCRPYGSVMGVRAAKHCVRYSDVSVFCGREHILFVDPDAETLCLLTRTDDEWLDEDFTTEPGVPLSAFGIELTWDEIFARR